MTKSPSESSLFLSSPNRPSSEISFYGNQSHAAEVERRKGLVRALCLDKTEERILKHFKFSELDAIESSADWEVLLAGDADEDHDEVEDDDEVESGGDVENEEGGDGSVEKEEISHLHLRCMALEEERNTALLERNAAQATIKQLRSKAAKIHRSAKSALICVEMAATDL
ncbi:hypothetical protein DXG01_010367, partial [Tephrocybe rancida]